MSGAPFPIGLSMARLSQLLARALTTAALLLWLVAEAQAHASFVRSEPADGAVLAQAPDRLHLVFSEPVSPLVLNLVGPTGERARLDRFQLHDRTLVIEPPAGLADGSYALSWRVTSADGHPIGGTVVFSIGAPGATSPVAEAAEPDELTPFIWATKLALYLGLFLGAGALAFHAFIAPAPPLARRVSLLLIGLGLASVAPSVALQGLDLMGAPLKDVGHGEVWAAAVSSAYFRTVLIAAVAMLVGLAAWFAAAAGRAVCILSAVALAGVGLALAASGHASAASPQWLMRPAVFLHAVGVAAWAGSLTPFLLVLRGDRETAHKMLTRYSATILPLVALLTLAGVALAIIQVERVDALWTTAYGRVLSAKLGLLLLLFTLAALNRLSLTPAFARREPRAGRQFARSVRMELVLICAILGVASLWRFTPPPRSLLAAEAAPAFVHIHSKKVMGELTLTPGRPGPVSASVHVMTGGGAPLEPKEITLSLSNAAAGIEPIRRKMTKAEDGRWRAEPLTLPAAGAWSVEIGVLVSDFEMATLEGEIRIEP